jgi:hypothetical protein
LFFVVDDERGFQHNVSTGGDYNAGRIQSILRARIIKIL